MDEQNTRRHPSHQVKRGSNTFKYIAGVVVVLFVGSFYFYIQKLPSTATTDHSDSPSAVSQKQLSGQSFTQPPDRVSETTAYPTDTSALQPDVSLPLSDVDSLVNKQSISPVNSSAETEGEQGARSAQPAVKNISDQIKQQLSAENNYQHLIDEINSFYAHLDKQPYVQNFGLKESSKIHFSNLLQKLADNPPVLIGETSDIFTLLQNTAHFFRIIGKDNINILKMILERENSSFEKILKDFYGLTYQPKYLAKEYSLSISPKTLTNYAAFFLNTIGGRLYLFRRDSTSRLIVTYYAVISIDRANSEGNGGHGIDIRPALHSLVEEIENGGKRLQLKEEYLDTLYDLLEKYN